MKKLDEQEEELGKKHYKLLRQSTKDSANLLRAKKGLKRAEEPTLKYVSFIRGYEDDQVRFEKGLSLYNLNLFKP